MSDEATFEPRARLTIGIDFKSPQAWLAVAPTRALEDELGIEADWLPLITRAVSPPREATKDDDRGTRHRAIRAQYYERDLQRYAALRRLPIGRASRADDSRIAGIGLRCIKPCGRAATRAYIDAVFSRYFTNGEPIALADRATIAAILRECGGDAAALPGADDPDFDRLQAQLRLAGFAQAPTYLLDGGIYYGRAHLPLLRTLLND